MVLDVVGSNRLLASPAPVAAYSNEIQQPNVIRAMATLGTRQHPYWAAPLDPDQDRAGSLHPDAQVSPRLGCPPKWHVPETHKDVRWTVKAKMIAYRLCPYFGVFSRRSRQGILAESLDDAPTRLGNAIRRLEEYGHNRYRLDSQALWYELTAAAPKQLSQQVDTARAGVDFFVCLLYGQLLAAATALASLVNGHWEIRLGGLVFSGLAATSFPGWWPRVLPAGGVRWPAGSPPCLPGPRRAGVSRPWRALGGRGGAAGRRWRWRGSWA